MWTKVFGEISEEDGTLVGGKGLALAQLSRLSVPVPAGFVVTTSAYDELIRRNAIDLADPDVGDLVELAPKLPWFDEEVNQQLDRLQGNFFAVRSSSISEDSADQSFAGIFDSFLNVPAAGVTAAIRRCYRGVFSPRAKHYTNTTEPIAVVVQEMVHSRLSGVLFTRHPTSLSEDELLVECCHGFGELMVSGEVTPESYVLDTATGTVLRQAAGSQKVKLVRFDGAIRTVELDGNESAITARELRSLVSSARKIEAFFAAPCDIEWCIDERGEFIVQSRPITTHARVPERRGEPHHYSKRFYSRILSPIFEAANVCGFRRYAREQFELPFDLSDYHRYQPSIQHPQGEVDIWVDDHLDTLLRGHLKKKIRYDIDYLPRLEQRYLETVGSFEECCRHLEFLDHHGATNGDLARLLADFDTLNQRMTSIYNAPIFTVNALAELVREEMRAIDPAEFDKDFATLAFVGVPNSAFFQEVEFLRIILVAKESLSSRALFNDALADPEVRALVDEYHRRWRFLSCTDVIGEAFPVDHFERNLQCRLSEHAEHAWAELQARQVQEADQVHETMCRYSALNYEMTWLRTWILHRNHTTEYYYRDFQYLKPLLTEVSTRIGVSYRGLLWLSVSEIVQALTGAQSDIADHARRRAQEGFTIEWRDEVIFLDAGVAPEERLERDLGKTEGLFGQVANYGSATGIVRIIRDPVAEEHRFNDGDILVTAMTTPSFVPLMKRSAAIVTDEGGVLCHAAIVSRELNKPCIIAVHNATQILREGALVEVDANAGTVTIRTEPADVETVAPEAVS